uniref:Uncharacterized protein n=1 Tax=Glossina morsitans morsitans TaxID=37546 RepID=A0A1B0G696_GLOMM
MKTLNWLKKMIARIIIVFRILYNLPLKTLPLLVPAVASLGFLTKAVTSYLLPSQLGDILAQARVFATAVLAQPGLKHACGLSRIQKEPRLLIASEDGFLYIYDFNTEKGGNCKLLHVHDLRGTLEGVIDKINNIDEDCSEDDQEVYDIDDDAAENYCDSFDSDTDEENILNIQRGQKRKRFIVSSESENEEEIENAVDGTVWKKIKEGSNSGRTSIYNIFKEVSGPTGYAKRNIMKGRAKSAFSLIIDHKMIEHVMATEFTYDQKPEKPSKKPLQVVKQKNVKYDVHEPLVEDDLLHPILGPGFIPLPPREGAKCQGVPGKPPTPTSQSDLFNIIGAGGGVAAKPGQGNPLPPHVRTEHILQHLQQNQHPPNPALVHILPFNNVSGAPMHTQYVPIVHSGLPPPPHGIAIVDGIPINYNGYPVLPGVGPVATHLRQNSYPNSSTSLKGLAAAPAERATAASKTHKTG